MPWFSNKQDKRQSGGAKTRSQSPYINDGVGVPLSPMQRPVSTPGGTVPPADNRGFEYDDTAVGKNQPNQSASYINAGVKPPSSSSGQRPPSSSGDRKYDDTVVQNPSATSYVNAGMKPPPSSSGQRLLSSSGDRKYDDTVVRNPGQLIHTYSNGNQTHNASTTRPSSGAPNANTPPYINAGVRSPPSGENRPLSPGGGNAHPPEPRNMVVPSNQRKYDTNIRRPETSQPYDDTDFHPYDYIEPPERGQGKHRYMELQTRDRYDTTIYRSGSQPYDDTIIHRYESEDTINELHNQGSPHGPRLPPSRGQHGHRYDTTIDRSGSQPYDDTVMHRYESEDTINELHEQGSGPRHAPQLPPRRRPNSTTDHSSPQETYEPCDCARCRGKTMSLSQLPQSLPGHDDTDSPPHRPPPYQAQSSRAHTPQTAPPQQQRNVAQSQPPTPQPMNQQPPRPQTQQRGTVQQRMPVQHTQPQPPTSAMIQQPPQAPIQQLAPHQQPRYVPYPVQPQPVPQPQSPAPAPAPQPQPPTPAPAPPQNITVINQIPHNQITEQQKQPKQKKSEPQKQPKEHQTPADNYVANNFQPQQQQQAMIQKQQTAIQQQQAMIQKQQTAIQQQQAKFQQPQQVVVQQPPIVVQHQPQAIIQQPQPILQQPQMVIKQQLITGGGGGHQRCSIFTCLCCCLVCGIVAIIYSNKARAARLRGNAIEARSHDNTACCCNVFGIIPGLIVWAGVAYLAYTVIMSSI